MQVGRLREGQEERDQAIAQLNRDVAGMQAKVQQRDAQIQTLEAKVQRHRKRVSVPKFVSLGRVWEARSRCTCVVHCPLSAQYNTGRLQAQEAENYYEMAPCS